MTTYYIHSNHTKPYKVIVQDKSVEVFFRIQKDTKFIEHLILKSNYDEIFIGKSPLNKMTTYSGDYGKKFDGNTILFRLGETYVFIGDDIKLFKTSSKIIKFVSPIGNNDIPYPFAIDENNDIYLMIEDVIMSGLYPKDLDYDKISPYESYYDMSLITKDNGISPPKEPFVKDFQNIKQFYIDDQVFTMRYVPNASKDYDRLIENFGKELFVEKTDGKKHKLTKNGYIKLMNDFGEKIKCRGF